jgi:NADH pyrophosphatase NudC (nudix superfamily)
VAVAVLTALVVGFLSELLSFRVKSRWCPRCGSSTTLPSPYKSVGDQDG